MTCHPQKKGKKSTRSAPRLSVSPTEFRCVDDLRRVDPEGRSRGASRRAKPTVAEALPHSRSPPAPLRSPAMDNPHRSQSRGPCRPSPAPSASTLGLVRCTVGVFSASIATSGRRRRCGHLGAWACARRGGGGSDIHRFGPNRRSRARWLCLFSRRPGPGSSARCSRACRRRRARSSGRRGGRGRSSSWGWRRRWRWRRYQSQDAQGAAGPPPRRAQVSRRPEAGAPGLPIRARVPVLSAEGPWSYEGTPAEHWRAPPLAHWGRGPGFPWATGSVSRKPILRESVRLLKVGW